MQSQDSVSKTQDQISRHLKLSLPSTPQASMIVDAAVESLNLNTSRGHDLLRYLLENNDALVSGRSDGPMARIKLLSILSLALPEYVVAARCVRCGRQIQLIRRLDGSRCCNNCYAKSRICVCVRCGSEGIIGGRDGGGYACARCVQRDPSRWEECASCGVKRRVVVRDEGRPLCQSCYSRPTYQCVACGRSNQAAHARTPEGPLCGNCYHQGRVATCSMCGITSSAVHRRPDTETYLCTSCWSPEPVNCNRCGALGVVKRSTFTNPVCHKCRRNALKCRNCVECGETRPVHSLLLHGAVCINCYSKMRDNPENCHDCGELRPLIGRDARGNRLCGVCNGDPRGWICHECGRFAALFADQRCRVCVATQRVHERLSTSDGKIHPQLTPLFDLLDVANHPTAALNWLLSSAWGNLLGVLATNGSPITHDSLDLLPPVVHVAHLRSVLVYAGVIPQRDELIENTAPWVDRFLMDQPTEIAVVLRAYAQWSVLRRARQRARRRVTGRGTTKYIRNLITLAAELMMWINDRDLSLEQVTQGDIDRWISEGSVNRQRVRDFLRWTSAQRLTRPLHIPVAARSEPHQFLPQDARWEALSRCAHDQNLDLRARVGGALVLLFGLTPTRIARIKIDDVEHRGKRVYLRIGSFPLLLPTPVASLVDALAVQAAACKSRFIGGSQSESVWLFPGARPGAHIDSYTLASWITAGVGVRIRPARNSALCALAQDLPAPVLAQVLGLQVEAAERWCSLVKPDWSAYLAVRDPHVVPNSQQ